MDPLFIAERLALLIALAVFLGLTFEEVYKRDDHSHPGGIRTFPVLSLTGAALYLIDPSHASVYIAGLLAVGVWLYPYLRDSRPSFLIPVCHLMAYALGPIALTQAPWIAVALTVGGVIFMSAREQMHRLATIIPQPEILTAGQFLILVAVILPIAPHEPLAALLPLTPFQIALAVAAVCTTAYVSYLVQRYIPSPDSILLPALMGGFYSSTAITVILAKRLKDAGGPRAEIIAGIIGATAVMYVRIDIILAIFDPPLALDLVSPLAVLFLCSAALAVWEWKKGGPSRPSEQVVTKNPLQLTAAGIFAVAFVLITVVSNWVRAHFGAMGIVGLALVVGLTDIDPFVTSLAQGGSATMPANIIIAAVLTAASSNNLLKAFYAVSFGGRRGALTPAIILAGLAVLGFIAAAVYGLGSPFGG